MNIIKQLSKTFIKVILVTLLSYNIYNFYCINVLNMKIATVNGYGMLDVISGSMEPNIMVGDLVIINTYDKDYKVNDIVTFVDVNNSLVTHRIVDIIEDTVVTKGDNNNTKDEAILKSSIIGKYVTKVNGLGNFINSLKNPIVMVVVLLVGVMVCILVSLDNKKLSKEEEKEFLDFKKSKDESGDK